MRPFVRRADYDAGKLGLVRVMGGAIDKIAGRIVEQSNIGHSCLQRETMYFESADMAGYLLPLDKSMV